MQPGEPIFRRSVAGQPETGRTCPYCRFALKESVQIAVCSVCGAPHHADCWQDNGGCAVVACAGGPTAAAVDRPTASTTPAAVPATTVEPNAWPPGSAVPPTWPPQPPPSPGGWWSPSLAAAILVLALAIGGAAVAIVISRQSNGNARLVADTNTTQTVTAPSSTVGTTVSTPSQGESEETETAPTTTSRGALPGVSSAQQTLSEIQQVLLEWHEDVVSGNYQAAWNLLSRRKQIQDGREYGYPTWVKNQATLRPYLNPSGLRVSVERTEPDGVDQVYVTGMAWDKPGSSCTEWSGITWVKHEHDVWRYDPGYSTTPSREREWKPRFSELLGGRC